MSISELAEELEKQIQKAALDGALTKDAVNQFHAILKQNESMANDILAKSSEITDLKAEVEQQNKQYGEQLAIATAYIQRESELKEREKETIKLELTALHEKQRVEDHKEMVRLVFRNTVLKKQVMTPVSSTVDSFGNRQTDYPAKDDVNEEET